VAPAELAAHPAAAVSARLEVAALAGRAAVAALAEPAAHPVLAVRVVRAAPADGLSGQSGNSGLSGSSGSSGSSGASGSSGSSGSSGRSGNSGSSGSSGRSGSSGSSGISGSSGRSGRGGFAGCCYSIYITILADGEMTPGVIPVDLSGAERGSEIWGPNDDGTRTAVIFYDAINSRWQLDIDDYSQFGQPIHSTSTPISVARLTTFTTSPIRSTMPLQTPSR
jgi:hypothetical protein